MTPRGTKPLTTAPGRGTWAGFSEGGFSVLVSFTVD